MTKDHKNPFPKVVVRYKPFRYKLNGDPFEEARKLINKVDSLKRWEITVPATTAWEPSLMRQLVTGLFAIQTPITLGIMATVHQFTWYVIVLDTHSTTVTQTLYAVHPQAELTSHAMQPQSGYYRYPLHIARPFLFPLKEIEAFTAFDLLTTLLSAMRQLRPDESMAYELMLIPSATIYQKLGQNFLDEWADRTDYRDRSTLNVLQAKFNSPLKVVSLAIKIRAKSRKRANKIAASTWSTWLQVAEPGFNALAIPGPETFQPLLSPGEVAALWHLPNEYLQVSGISWTPSINLSIPEPLINLRQGIVLGTNRYQGRKYKARLTHADRASHVTIIGITSMGKSTLMHHMIHQDLEQGKRVGVIDPHGDLEIDILRSSISKKRAKDVIRFDTHDRDCPSLNPLANLPGVPRYLIARQALDLIKKLCADDWPGAQTERYFAMALRALVEYPGTTLMDIPKLLSDKAYRAQVLTKVTDENVKRTWDNYDRLHPGSQAKITDPILNRLDRFYNDPVLERIVCQPTSLDFCQIIDQGKIFLANLGAFQEEREANTLGALLLSKFQFAAMSRGELSKAERRRKTYYLYIDELQRFTTTSLPIIYDQARKYGLSLTGAFQRLSQMAGEDFKGIASGVGNLIAFGTTREDAKILAPFMGDQVSASDVAGLNQYTALVSMRLHGQSVPTFSIKTESPLPENPEADEIITDIRNNNRATYGQADKASQEAAFEADHTNEENDDPETPIFFG